MHSPRSHEHIDTSRNRRFIWIHVNGLQLFETRVDSDGLFIHILFLPAAPSPGTCLADETILAACWVSMNTDPQISATSDLLLKECLV
jgi:hypothetical protein